MEASQFRVNILDSIYDLEYRIIFILYVLYCVMEELCSITCIKLFLLILFTKMCTSYFGIFYKEFLLFNCFEII